MCRKAKVVLYNNEVKIVSIFKDKEGDHARLFFWKSKCPLLLPSGKSNSYLIKRWCPA